VQEAQSLGLPVICSDVCAAAESIIDGHNGFLFKSGDHEDLAKKLWALQDDELAASMGLDAYERFWRDPPTPERHLELTLQMYEEVLESRARE
jgi:glycosyltransferase involved in cell wall biosynthesis